jgi:ABC-type glycerol-3-phosphate transport system permease component
MVTTSFQAGDKMYQLATEWIPEVWHPENYPNGMSRAAFPTYFLNSFVVSIAIMFGNVVFGTLAGYGLAKFRFPGERLVLLIILSTLMLPLEVTLIPTFLVVHHFGWLNSYQGMVGPLFIEAFGVFLMRQSILTIPSDYIEAARIDGAGELKILWKVIVPMSCRSATAGTSSCGRLPSSRRTPTALIRSASFVSKKTTATRRPSSWRSRCWRPFPFSCCSPCSSVGSIAASV